MPNEIDAAIATFKPRSLKDSRLKTSPQDTSKLIQEGYEEERRRIDAEEKAALKSQVAALSQEQAIQKEERKLAEQHQEDLIKAENDTLVPQWRAEGRPTYRESLTGRVRPVHDDATWADMQEQKKLEEEQKAQAKADAAFRKAESVRLNKESNAIEDDVARFKTAGHIASQAVQAKAAEITTLNNHIKNLEDTAASEADLARLDSLRSRRDTAIEEKAALENNERTIGIARTNRELELAPEQRKIEQQRAGLPIMTAPRLDAVKSAAIDVPNPSPEPASADPTRTAAVLRDHITLLREKGDFERADALERRLTDPEAWNAEQAAFRAGATAEQLQQTIESQATEITARAASLRQNYDALKASQQQYVTLLDKARSDNEQLLAGTYSDGDVVEVQTVDGQTERWHKGALGTYQQAAEGLRRWEAENRGKIDLLDVDRQQLQIDASNLDKHQKALAYKGREQQRNLDAERATALSKLRAEPGMAPFADEIEAEVTSIRQRTADISRKYTDPALRSSAMKALDEELRATRTDRQQRMQAVQDSAKDLYESFGKNLNITDWANDASVGKGGSIDLAGEARRRGFTEEEGRRILDMARKSDWTRPMVGEAAKGNDYGPDIATGIGNALAYLTGNDTVAEPSRNLPDGSLSINPALWLDEKAYMKAASEAATGKDAKDQARKVFPKLQEMAAAAMVSQLETELKLPGLPDFNTWRTEFLQANQENARQPLAQQALAYLKDMKARNPGSQAVDSLARNLTKGLLDLGSTLYGAALLATGSESVGRLAQDSNALAQSAIAAGDQKTSIDGTLLRAGNLTAQLLPQLAPIMIGGGLLAATGRISPMLGASILSGTQTAGLQEGSSYTALRAKGLTHKQAYDRTWAPALTSGIMTGLLTFLGGKTGGEAALAGLMNKAGREAAREALRKSVSSVGGLLKTIGANAAGEIAEEVPDELFSQISEAIATEGPRANLAPVIDSFVRSLPELALSVGAIGGGTALATEALNRSSMREALLAEDVAAAEGEIDLYSDDRYDEATNDQIRNRASLALAIARGVDLNTIDESILNAAGWTRRDTSGVTRADGSLTKLKDYTGPNMLDVDSNGRVKLDSKYAEKLKEHMPVLAGLVSKKHTDWHTPGKIEDTEQSSTNISPASPATGQTAASSGEVSAAKPVPGTRGTSGQGPVKAAESARRTIQTPVTAPAPKAGGAASPAAPPAAPIDPATQQKERIRAQMPWAADPTDPRPQRAWEVVNHLEMAGLPRDQAEAVAIEHVKKNGIIGKSVNEQVTSDQFTATLDGLGATGDRTTRAGTEPLKITKAPANQQSAKNTQESTPATDHPVLALFATVAHGKQETTLRQHGASIQVVETEAQAEAILGSPLKKKGRKAVTALVDGKPVVIFIATNIQQLPGRDMKSVMSEEFHHAAALLVLQNNPELLAQAQAEAANLPKGNAIYNGWDNLSPTAKVIEAAAAYAAGKWTPGQSSAIRRLMDSIIQYLGEVFGMNATEAQTAAADAIRRLADNASALLSSSQKSTRSQPSAAPKGGRPEYQTMRQKLAAREMSTIEALREVVRLSGEHDTGVLQDILTDHLGLKKPTAAAAVETLRAAGELTGEPDDIPLAAGKRASGLQYTASKDFAPASTRDLPRNTSQARARIAALASLPPRARRWGWRYINALEGLLAQNAPIFEAFMVGPNARRLLAGQQIAVMNVNGRVTLLVDLHALMRNVSDLGDPRRRAAATISEETWHAAQLHLERSKPEKWNKKALASQWNALPPELKQKVWSAYHNAGSRPLPDKFTPAEAYALQSEFLRMLGQGSIDPASITETIDPAGGLMQQIRDLLADLYATLRNLIKGLPASQAQTLDQQVAELRAVRDSLLQQGPPSQDALARMVFLRDPVATFQQALRNGTLWEPLARQEPLFTEAGLARVWQLLTPEFRLAAERDPSIASAATPQEKARLLTERLMDRSHARTLAQTVLQPTSEAKATTSTVRRMLNSLMSWLQGNRQTLAGAIAGLDKYTAEVLSSMQAHIAAARAEFEAAAGVQSITSSAIQQFIAEPQADYDDELQAARSMMPSVVDSIQRRLSLPPDRVGPPTAAELSAQTMVKTWLENAVTEKAFFDIAYAAAEFALPGVSDAARKKMMERWQASQANDARRAKINEEWNVLVRTIQERVARQYSPWKSARESAEVIETLIRKDIQEAWASAVLRTAANAERRYYSNAGELSPEEARQIDSLMLVAAGELELGWQADRRQIGTAADSGAPIRQMGFGREEDLRAIGINIEPDGTAWAERTAPVYIERGRIIIKQLTLDDLSERLPITRQMIRMSEAQARAHFGLTGTPAPVTNDSIAAQNADRAAAITARRQAARLNELEQAERDAQEGSEPDEETGALLDPGADPQTGKLQPGERGDIISWLSAEGSLGWPDANMGGEWDWLKPYLAEYFNVSLNRTRTKILKDKAGNVIGKQEVAAQATKLGISNSSRSMARRGDLSTPGAVVEWLIQNGVLTPAVTTHDNAARDLSPHPNVTGGAWNIDAVEEAAKEANYAMQNGIGHAVLDAIEARKAARRARLSNPEAAGELQALRFERDTRAGPFAVEAHQLATLADEGPTYVTVRSPDADLTQVEVVDSEWQPIDTETREIEDYLDGHPAFRGISTGRPERLVVTLSGGTLYGRQTVPGEAILRVHDTGNTGIGVDLSEYPVDAESFAPADETPEQDAMPAEDPAESSFDDAIAQYIKDLTDIHGLAASHRWTAQQVEVAREEMYSNQLDDEYTGGNAWFDPRFQKWINLGNDSHYLASGIVHEFGYGPVMAAGFVRVTTETYGNGKSEIYAEFFGPPTRRLRKVMEDTAMLQGMDPSYDVHLEANAERFYGNPDDANPPLAAAERFYSRLAQVVSAKMPNRATPDLVRNLISNPQTGIKQEELKWSGILSWLDKQNGQISKDTVLNYLRTEGAVQFIETRLGNLNDKFTYRPTQRPERNGQGFDVISPAGEFIIWEATEASAQEAIANMDDGYNRVGGGMQSKTRNSNWTLPGGTNHQEVVVTWKQPESINPDSPISVEMTDDGDYIATSADGTFTQRITGPMTAERAQIVAEHLRAQRIEKRVRQNTTPNTDSDRTHYGDLDALAWFRANDRTDANGQPGLFVEEFQSKWHQQGREKGYRDTDAITKLQEDLARAKQKSADALKALQDATQRGDFRGLSEEYITAARQAAQAEEFLERELLDLAAKNETAIPDAPYRKDWPLMLFKRALADAVASGKAWIGWTSGDTQADRYDLSKQVSKIGVTRTASLNYSIDAMPTDGGRYTEIAADIPAEKLTEHVGKELAAKIIQRDIAPGTNAIFTGLDLKVGGEGMRKFYDGMLVKEFGKYVKQWGGKVTKSEVASATTLSEPTWQTFDNSDWDTFGGAEPFANNDDPVIAQAQLLIDGQPRPVSVILDANGMQVIDGDGENVWMVPNTIFPGQMSEGWWQSAASAQNSAGIAWTNKTHRLWSSFDTILGEEATLAPMLGTTPIWRIDITPAMRESVSAGQPLFASRRVDSRTLETTTNLVNSALERNINQFDKFAAELHAKLPQHIWNISRPYLFGAWDIVSTLNNLPRINRDEAERVIERLESSTTRPAQKSPAPEGISQQPTPKSPAPGGISEDMLWEMGLDDNPTPDPYEVPPGRRVVQREGTEASATTNKSHAPEGISQSGGLDPVIEDPDAPKKAELGFEVEAHAKDKKQKENIKKLKEAIATLKARPDSLRNREILARLESRLEAAVEDLIQARGATLEQRQQALDEVYGDLAPGITLRNTTTRDGSVVPHIMRGRALMLDIGGVPHVATRQVALPSVGSGHAPGVRFLPLAGDKSNWTGHINAALAKTFPRLDAETDIYMEPYGGGLVYLQNLDILRRTSKPVLISVSQEFEPERWAIYSAIARNDQQVIQDIRATLKDPTRKPTTPEGKSFVFKLWGDTDKVSEKAAAREAFEQLPNLAALLQKPNVKLMPWRDAETFRAAVDRARGGKRITLLEDSNYADLFGENTENQYRELDDHPELPGIGQQKEEFIGKNPEKLLAQKLPVYRAVLDADGTIIATNNMNHTLLGGLLAEFGDQGHWFGYAHRTRPVKDGWLQHPDGKGVLWSTERPEYLAILRKGVVTDTPKYGTDTPSGLDYRPGPRRSAAGLYRTAQARREPSPFTGGSREAAEASLRRAQTAGNPGFTASSGKTSNVSDPTKSPRAPSIERTMAPLPPGAAATPLDAAQWDADAQEQRALADAADTIEDELGDAADRILDDPRLSASLRQAFPGVPAPTDTEVRQILASAPRRARQSMEFDPPFKAPFGDILRYDWTSRPVGDMQSQRISDWNNATTNGQTGRQIVHLFKVRKPDGIHTVSLETAMGMLSADQRTSLNRLIRAHHQRQQDEAAGQLKLFAAPRTSPSQSLVIYRRLTAERNRLAQEGRNLTPDQAQRLEQAERQLGQVMMDFLPPVTTTDLRLESEPTRTRGLDRSTDADQLRLFASNRAHSVAPALDLRYTIADGQDPQTTRPTRDESNPLDPRADARSGTAQRFPSSAQDMLPWARAQGWLIDTDDLVERLRLTKETYGGDEHDVWEDELTQRAVKITKDLNGIPAFVAGSPAAYLENLRRQNALFGTGFAFEGIVDDNGTPRFVISQPWIIGTAAPQKAKEDYFRALGFEPVSQDSFYSSGRDLLVTDARAANVFQRPDGTIQPIDLQTKLVSGRQAEMYENRAAAYNKGLASAPRTPAQTIEATGLAPAISVRGTAYTGRAGMTHGAVLGDYVWRKIFTPQQRRDDPNQDNAINFAFDTWMDSRRSGFDDFGFLDTRSGKFLTREEAYTLLTERGFATTPESYSTRFKSLDSSDLFWSQPKTPILASATRTPAQTIKATGLAANQDNNSSFAGRLDAANRKVEKYQATGGAARWIVMADLGRWIDWNRYPTLDALQSAAQADFQTTRAMGSPLADALPYVSSVLKDPNQQGNPTLQALRQQHGNDPQTLAAILLPKLQAQHKAVTKANADYLVQAHADDPFFQSAMLRATMSDLGKTSVAFPVTLYPVAVAITRTAWNDGKLHSLPAMLETYQQHANDAAEVALRSINAAKNIEGLEGGEWITLPQVPANVTNAEKEAIFASWEALSHPNWCTSRGMARTYAPRGKMAVYRKNGTSLLAIRFEGDDVVEVQSPNNDGTVPLEYIPEVNNYASSSSPRTQRTLAALAERSEDEAKRQQRITNKRARFLASLPINAAPEAVWDANGFIQLEDGSYAADETAENHFLPENDPRLTLLAYSESLPFASLPNLKQLSLKQMRWLDNQWGSPKDEWPSLQSLKGHIAVYSLAQVPSLTQIQGSIALSRPEKQWQAVPEPALRQLLDRHQLDTPKAAPKNYKLVKFQSEAMPNWRQLMSELESLLDQYSPKNQPSTLDWGSLNKPASLPASERLAQAAQKTNTTPTEAQKQAENYQTGKVTVHGLRLSIENPRGSVRRGTDANGKAWEITMPHHYGRILGTHGADKDHVDFFMGPDPDSPTAFVINQRKPGNGHFDEHKVMLGFTSAGLAARGYLDSYTKGWTGYQSIVPMTLDQLKHWLEHGKMGEAVTKTPVVSNDTKPLASSSRDPYTLANSGINGPSVPAAAAKSIAQKLWNLMQAIHPQAGPDMSQAASEAEASRQVLALLKPHVPVIDRQTIRSWRKLGKGGEGTVYTAHDPRQPALPMSEAEQKLAPVVYKVLESPSEDQVQLFGISPQIEAESGKAPKYDLAPTRTLHDLLKRLVVHNYLGGTPTELAAVTTDGHIVLKQPMAQAAKTAGNAIPANLGAVPIALKDFPKDISVVSLDGTPYLLADIRDENMVRDTQGKLRMNDFLIQEVTSAQIAKAPFLKEYVQSAMAREPDRAFQLFASPRHILDATSKASFNHLDRKLTRAIGRMADGITATEPVAAAIQAARDWHNGQHWTAQGVRAVKDFLQQQFLPETVLPREVLSAMRTMNIKTAMGQQQALDLNRALSGSPKFSDLAYPPEFIENPAHREAMFDAMEQGTTDRLPEPLRKLAEHLRSLLVEHGREAVRQGRMSPDTFEGLRTTYMPRFTRDEAQASAGDWSKRFKLGIKDILAQRSTAWHIVDTSRKDKTGQPVIVSHSKGKWRFANAQARDAHYEELIQRETLNPDLSASQDWHWMTRKDARLLRSLTPEALKAPATLTKEQREIVGRVQRQLRQQFRKEDPYQPKDLVKDPVYAVMRYLAQMAHDNATAEFFNLIDANPTWTTPTESKGFTQIPDSDRFGALAGKWVRADIADQVLELADVPNQFWQLYDGLLRLWKTGKTVLNPATHARNILGNIPFAQMAGNNPLNPANWMHYAAAARVLRDGGAEYRQLYESGVLGADYASTELKAALHAIVPVEAAEDGSNPIRTLISIGNRAAQWAKAHSAANLSLATGIGATLGGIAAGPIGAMAGAGLGAGAGAIYRGALWAYRMEDDLFKAATYLKAREMGMTIEQAAEHVRAWFPYYDKPTSEAIKLAGRTALPFVSFFRESGRIFTKALKERPLALATTLAIPTLVTLVSEAMLGLTDKDDDDVKKGMRGKAAKLLGPTPLAGMPLFSMLTPWRTADGQLQQIDLSSTHPFADFLADRVENWNNDPWWQTAARAALSNPILGLIYTASTGRDPFGDRVLWDSTYTPEEKGEAVFGHLWKTVAPPLAPGGTNWTMIEQSGRRVSNKTMALRSPTQAVARGIAGIDVRSADPNIYDLADQFRRDRGLPVQEGNVAFPTDPAGRARKALFDELVQPSPNPDIVAKHLQTLNDLGKPVRTSADVLDIIERRRPDAVINPKALRGPFRASLAPEARRVLDRALEAYRTARAAAPGSLAAARMKVKATTRSN